MKSERSGPTGYLLTRYARLVRHLTGHEVPKAPRLEDLGMLLRTVQRIEPYRAAMQAVAQERVTRETSGWSSYPVLDTESLRCHLFVLEPGAQIAPHDHVGMRSVLLVTRGTLRVERFRLVSLEAVVQGIARLHRERVQSLSVGDISSVDGFDGEIHGLVNPSQRPTLFLDVIWHGGLSPERHFFFPTTGQGKEVTATVIRDSSIQAIRAHQPLTTTS